MLCLIWVLLAVRSVPADPTPCEEGDDETFKAMLVFPARLTQPVQGPSRD